MSKYTTQIKEICGFLNDNTPIAYSELDAKLAVVRSGIFDFNYPIFDENYKSVLEVKILKHYYTREICEETFGLWKLRLNAKMNEIMPYYNQLYRSELITFNPLGDVEFTRRTNRNTTAENLRTSAGNDISASEDSSTNYENESVKENSDIKSESAGNEVQTHSEKGNTSSTDAFSETPQGSLNGVDTLNYLTNARKITEQNSRTNDDQTATTQDFSQTGENKSDTQRINTAKTRNTQTRSNENNETINGNTLEDYIELVSGKMGLESNAERLVKFRKTFLNIDTMIINDLSTLFFGLW